ncbi:hypothetical protein D3C72_1655110 [compost metagenome]
MDTSALPPAVLVQEPYRMPVVAGVLPCGVPMLGERHGQRQLAKAPAPSACLRPLAQQPGPLALLPVRHLAHCEHASYLRIVGLQAGIGHLFRPAAREGLRPGFHGDVGVDQRTATDSGPGDDPDVGECPDISPAIEAVCALLVPQPGIALVARESRRAPAPSALQHQDFAAGLREPAGRDRATEAAADDDDIVGKRIAHHDAPYRWMMIGFSSIIRTASGGIT